MLLFQINFTIFCPQPDPLSTLLRTDNPNIKLLTHLLSLGIYANVETSTMKLAAIDRSELALRRQGQGRRTDVHWIEYWVEVAASAEGCDDNQQSMHDNESGDKTEANHLKPEETGIEEDWRDAPQATQLDTIYIYSDGSQPYEHPMDFTIKRNMDAAMDALVPYYMSCLNEEQQTPLHLALKYNSAKCFFTLMDNPEVENMLHSEDSEGWKPLHRAVKTRVDFC